MTTTTEHNAFPRGRWSTPNEISTASQADVKSGGSEQNSQPRLASEEAEIRQVPSNAGAVDDLNAECGVRSAEPAGCPFSSDGKKMAANASSPLRPEGASAGGSRPTGPDSYPLPPGSKGGKSSRAAAGLAAREAELTREQVLSLLLCHDFNADTLACLIRKDVHNVRSRCSELAEDQSIFFSGRYSSENNSNGIKTKVWTTRRPQSLTARNAENTKR